MQGRDRHTAEAMAYHEGVPGHQVALAQELTDLPVLRRLAPIDAFAEGWARYAERLADDSVRAARLVVDTGLHALGWSASGRSTSFVPTPRCRLWTSRRRPTGTSPIPGRRWRTWLAGLEIDRLRAGARRRTRQR